MFICQGCSSRFTFQHKQFSPYAYNLYVVNGFLNAADTRPNIVHLQWNLNDCIIKYEDVKLERELNRGNFGVVYLGFMRSMKVAVKKSRTTTNDEAFCEEARVMHILSHPRIVRFLGFCCDAPDGRALIKTEYMPNGALLDYLHTAVRQSLTYQHLTSIIDQVVKTMVCLEEVRVVHRDLRAANVLVDADGSVKWTAPEAMKKGYEPNTKADAWSFGVLMFEILIYGKMPFEEYTSTSQLQKFLSEGGRLPSSQSLGFQCEDSVYSIMKTCWEPRTEMRPSFHTLSRDIEQSIISREGLYDTRWNERMTS
ncbi:Tyrosine-protein kinase SPK-1 [Taenia solium]|eukprot:TsM_000179900 transcript=TsM_000179900 gene=TsM_000179900